jgi:minor extracellular serine protease Vpr
MDVISMSLGGTFGTATSSDSIASDNAAKAGIVVVAAAGNAGPVPYVTGAPATANDSISVAAMDARQFIVNGVHVALSSGSGADGVEANSLALPHGRVPAVILTKAGSLSLGCSAADYPAAGAHGALVIVSRGTCSFVAKASAATAAGAVAIGVVNNAAGLFNPAIPGVTIPFIELEQSDSAKFLSATAPVSASITPAQLPNAGFKLAASFSSGGPRTGDGALKPDVTAPGVNVFSTNIGTGNGGTYDSGTSMATPHVAGVAALAIQAHRQWAEPSVRAAVVETASPTALGGYAPRIEGAGLVEAVGATTTDVTVSGDEDRELGLLSFGVAELTRDFHEDRELIVRNHGRIPATFTATATPVGGVPHTVTLSSSTVSVEGHDDASLRVSLTVPAATAGSTHDAAGNDVLQEVAGYITLQPTVASANHGVSLHLPYYLVPRARSNVSARLREEDNPSIRLENRNGVIAGNGDFYAWGLKNPKTGAISASFEPRAIGVQSFPFGPDQLMFFAVNTYGRFSNAALGEYDISIDVNGDGKADFILFSADIGFIETGSNNGQIGSFLLNLATNALFFESPADAPTDGSIVLMPVFASDLGISPTNPRFSYSVIAFDGSGSAGEAVPGTGYFNAFAPAVSNAMFVPVAPNTTTDVPVAIDRVEFTKTPAIGFMVVTQDNRSGASEAALLPLDD